MPINKNSAQIELATDLSAYPFIMEKIQRIPYAFAKKWLLLPLSEEMDQIQVAICNAYDLESLEELRCLIGKDIEEVQATKEAIENAIEICYRQEENEASLAIADLKGDGRDAGGESSDGYDLLEKREDSPIVRLLNVILLEAIQQGASDIHFEPFENEMVIRYRIDGVLHNRHAPSREYLPQVITRLKVMAKLDIAEHRLPQDGRIKLRLSGREIDFRLSTIPVIHGERVVLRILDKSNFFLGLEKLGMPPLAYKNFCKLIHRSEGIVLVTGPTGSGKTTTLYSGMHEIASEQVNIMTIEDPVEYKFQGIAQIGVNPKINLSFARGLRHILRQDPDVIMIGEIRDQETAEIAIQSSLTGHLVLSTLHTNDAPSAITRLIDMGIAPYLLSSSVIGILAQRLLRKICPHCKEAYTPSDAEIYELGLTAKEVGNRPFYKGRGCKNCFNSGFHGRQGIYELMVVNEPIKRKIAEKADALELKKSAILHGMSPLHKEGAELVLKGVTSFSEVVRVSSAEEL